jgi:hypothetical protein
MSTMLKRWMKRGWIVALALGSVALGVAARAEAEPAGKPSPQEIAVVVNPKNKKSGISLSELRAIMLRHRTRWPDGKVIVFLNRQAGSKIRKAMDRIVLKMSPDQSAAYWIDRKIRGKGSPPRSFGSGLLIQRIVSNTREAVSYVMASKVKPGVKVLKVEGMLPGGEGYALKTKR